MDGFVQRAVLDRIAPIRMDDTRGESSHGGHRRKRAILRQRDTPGQQVGQQQLPPAGRVTSEYGLGGNDGLRVASDQFDIGFAAQ
jgi:hypothetical protein